jgi:hypothetical protein
LKILYALGASESGSTCVVGSVESIFPDCTIGSKVGLDKTNKHPVRENLIMKIWRYKSHSVHTNNQHDKLLRYPCTGLVKLLQLSSCLDSCCKLTNISAQVSVLQQS